MSDFSTARIVDGAIAVSDHAVHVTARLGLLLSPLRGRIERDIREKLDQHWQIGEAAAARVLTEFLDDKLGDYSEGRDLPRN